MTIDQQSLLEMPITTEGIAPSDMTDEQLLRQVAVDVGFIVHGMIPRNENPYRDEPRGDDLTALTVLMSLSESEARMMERGGKLYSDDEKAARVARQREFAERLTESLINGFNLAWQRVEE